MSGVASRQGSGSHIRPNTAYSVNNTAFGLPNLMFAAGQALVHG
jgi:hypothetical protein